MRNQIAISFLVLSSGSFAAGFDCSKATTFIEQAICSNKQLSELDDSLAKAYKKSLASQGNAETIKNRQKEWLSKERNACKDVSCIKNSYDKRLAELTKSVATSLEAGKEVTIPDNEQWIINSFMPYVSENGIGTADLYVEGGAIIGEKFSLSGKFDLSVSPGPSGEIVILGGSKLSVGDSRGKVTFKVKLAN